MRAAALVLVSTLACGPAFGATTPSTTTEEAAMADLDLTSADFEQGAAIPERFTCEGEDLSPELSWSEGPEATKSYAIVVDDPDAPNGTWVHWVLWDLPPDQTTLQRGTDAGSPGKNDFGNNEYGGPCPPPGHGEHRYVFKVYALDTALELAPTTDKAGLEQAMEGHVLAQGQLMGTYERTK